MLRNKNFYEYSAALNTHTFDYYINRLTDLAVSRYKWNNLPTTVDERYIELTLLNDGKALYFEDDIVGELALSFTSSGRFDVYGEPILRRAYSKYNNYKILLKSNNSVIIWNNFLRQPSYSQLRLFAVRLYALDRIIDVNANAQKTPILLHASKKQRLTLLNLFKEYDGNSPVIFGDKNLDIESINVLKTDAPFVADKIYELKVNIWNEAMTYLGIANEVTQKKERMIKDEVARNMGGTIASRYSQLAARNNAADKINNMFGTKISVEYRYPDMFTEFISSFGGESNE